MFREIFNAHITVAWHYGSLLVNNICGVQVKQKVTILYAASVN